MRKTPRRSPRFSIPNNEQVVVAFGSDRVSATLTVLSLTGGTVRMTRRAPRGTFADLTVQTIVGPVTAAIELLRPIDRSTQAFRIVHIDLEDRRRLEDTLVKLREQGFGRDQGHIRRALSFAGRMLVRLQPSA